MLVLRFFVEISRFSDIFDSAPSDKGIHGFTKGSLWKSFDFYRWNSEFKEIPELVKFQRKIAKPTLLFFSYPMKSKKQPFIWCRSNFHFRIGAADFRFLPSARLSVTSLYRETLTSACDPLFCFVGAIKNAQPSSHAGLLVSGAR